jgi:hypothetical protein
MKTWFQPVLSVIASMALVGHYAGAGEKDAPPDPSPVSTPKKAEITRTAETKAAALPPARTFRSAWTEEVLKLADARMDEAVVRAYIDNAGTFNLGAEDLIRLNELNCPPELVALMLQHDTDIALGLRPEPPAPPVAPKVPIIKAAKVPVLKARVEGASPKPSEPESSIVNPSPAPDYFDFMGESEVRLASDIFRTPHTVVKRPYTSVRQPHAVPLTDPILVHRAVGRVPNNIFVESFP